VSIATAAGYLRVIALLLAALFPARWALLVGVALYGVSGISTLLVHKEILQSAYGPSGMVQAFHRSALRIGNAIVAATVAPVVLLWPSHWSTSFFVLGVVSAIGPLTARHTHRRPDRSGPDPSAQEPAATVDTHWMLEQPALRVLLPAFAIGSLFEVPLYVFAFGAMSTRWAVGGAGRSGLAGTAELLGVVFGAAAVRRGARRRDRKAANLRIIGMAMLAGAVLLGASMAVRGSIAYVLLFALALGMFAFMAPMLFAGTLTMLPPLRRQFWGAAPTCALVVMTVGASACLTWIADAFGDQAAVAWFGLPAALLALLVIIRARSINPDAVPPWWSRWPVPASAIASTIRGDVASRLSQEG
jgi:hypothetical protein